MPLLGITKSISPVPVTENGSLTYTFLIQNEGNVPANEATAVIVTDTFNPILSNLTVTFNGSTWTEGEDYTYDKTTGTFATGAGKVTVPAATFTVNETTGEWSSNPFPCLHILHLCFFTCFNPTNSSMHLLNPFTFALF